MAGKDSSPVNGKCQSLKGHLSHYTVVSSVETAFPMKLVLAVKIIYAIQKSDTKSYMLYC